MIYLCLFLFVIPPALQAVVKEELLACRSTEFSCGDSCLDYSKVCDGSVDCSDGEDEAHCSPMRSDVSFVQHLKRDRRQATGKCSRSKWQCRDGTCINFDGKCDGIVDCPDRSDETYPLCRNMLCQSNWFRCTYGACVDGNSLCNGQKDCADESDELSPVCRNTTDEIKGQFRCQNGQFISANNRCDGVSDCADGSDESIRACANRVCPTYLFQCAYGACVDSGSDCNGKVECADGSDESDELCNRMGTPNTGGTTDGSSGNKPSPTGACILPAYPEHGTYVVPGVPNAAPGQAFESSYLNVTCNIGYQIAGNQSDIFCLQGRWSGPVPQCIRFCKLNKHPSVEYRCLNSGNDVQGTYECREWEPVGTVVNPQCRTPNYYFSGVLNYMHCLEAGWDYVAVCTPECGRVTPDGEILIIGGVSAKRGELPWHAGIYRKLETPYLQICGGSLVTATVVISAAHCFWSDVEKLLPAANYAVALGKLYRPWNNPYDPEAQKSDVRDIIVPKRYDGIKANFQEDIAILILVTTIQFQPNVRPVCVNFDYNFDRRQLQEGKKGKVAGWGLTAENGMASQVLKVVELPYIDINRCIDESPPTFREYITSDKICAGYQNGTALCKGDSGGGLAFPEYDRGTERYYLRGIVSTAPQNDNVCNANAYTSFTQITRHEHFIREYLQV